MFVDKDKDNNIVAIYARRQNKNQEFIEGAKLSDMRNYSEKRRDEYPDIGDQLDAIMKWVAGENEIKVTPELKSIAMKCMSVKSKYPKPNRDK